MMDTKFLEKNFFSRHRKNWIVFPRKNCPKPDQVFAIVRQRNQELDFPFIWETFLFSNRKRLVKGRNVKERVRTGTQSPRAISACQGNSDISSVWLGQR